MSSTSRPHRSKIAEFFHRYPTSFCKFDKKENPCYFFHCDNRKEKTWILKSIIMVVPGQIFKYIPSKSIEKLKNRYKIQTRSFSETSHAAAMLFAQLSHALSLNDDCDCLKFHRGCLVQIRDCTPPSRNGLAHANATRDAALAEELFRTVFADIKETYPEFISGSRSYPGMLWRQQSLSALIKLLEYEENETSPPIKLSAVQMQSDFGNI